MKYILLLLPLLVHARININIIAASIKNLASIKFSGNDTKIISNEERKTFKIDDDMLKSGVENITGQRPTQVFLKSPTPWGDLYKVNDWFQVKRTLKPKSAKVLGIHTKPVIVSSQVFVNNGTNEVKYTSSIIQQLEDTISESWSKGGEFSIGQDISVSISFVEATTSVSYTSAWGKDSTTAHSITVGSNVGVEVILKPGKQAEASLRATRGTMEIQIDYMATVEGDVAVRFANKYSDSKSWAFDINRMLEINNLPTEIASREIMKIGFYSDTNVVVEDYVPI